MADVVYNGGLDELATWETDTFAWLLLKASGYTPDPDDRFVDDLTPGTNEIAGTGYARVTATTPTRTIDDTLDRITYDADDPAFGSIITGETFGAMVLYRFVTNDSDSILVGHYELSNTATDGTAVTPTLAVTGVAYIDAA